MKATVFSVNLDPRRKTADVILQLETGGLVNIGQIPFDPPKDIPLNEADNAAVQQAVKLLNRVTVD